MIKLEPLKLRDYDPENPMVARDSAFRAFLPVPHACHQQVNNSTRRTLSHTYITLNAAVHFKMSTPQAKRRRLNDATNTLKKPFKSPFRTPVKPSIGSDPPSSDPPDISTPARSTLYTNQVATPHTVSSALAPPKPTAAAAPPLQPRFVKPPASRPNGSTTSRAAPVKAPSKPSLTRELIQLRNEIQILTQAHALATSTKDEDLQVLVDKWRTASRAAAEELFGSTRDRVNRMGGVGAWKVREKEAKERTMKWDHEEKEAEKERMEEARENGDMGDEAYDRYAELAEEHSKQEEEDDTLKAADDDVSLNIRLDISSC